MKSRCDLSVTNLIYPFAVSVQLFLSLFLHTFIIANYAVRVNRKLKGYANKITRIYHLSFLIKFHK